MPSQAMQDLIDALRDRRKASAGQAPPTLDERRAAFIPGDRLHPVPDDVLVKEVTAGGVPAHWLTAPGADPGRVLLFLHGGGFEFSSGASMTERANQDPISTPAMLRQFAADYLAGLTLRRPWRRRCSPHCPGSRRC